jgi:hypothetical protein
MPEAGEAAGGTAAGETSTATLAVFLLVVAVAVWLRFWNLGSAGISSSESGRCTAAALEPGSVSGRVPSLSPAVFRTIFALWEPVDTLAIGATALLGVATVVALFLAGRTAFGDAAALAGAAALSAMELHVVASRQAGNEIPIAFLSLAGVWACGVASRRKSFVPAFLGVLAIGAAAVALAQGLSAPRPAGPPWSGVFALRCLARWTSPLVLGAALIGVAAALRRRSGSDRVLLAWAALSLLASVALRPDPGSAVPVLPPLALLAGVGLEATSRLAAPGWRRWRPAVLALLLLVPGILGSSSAVDLEDRGYELASRFLAQGPRDPRPDVLALEPAILFYLAGAGDDAHAWIDADAPAAIAALESGSFRYLVGDVRLARAPALRGLIERKAADLRAVAAIGNPLAGPTLAAAAGFDAVDDPREREELTRIRVWRPLGPGRR